MSYVQALFTAFRGPIFYALAFAHIIVANLLVRASWPEPLMYAHVVAVLEQRRARDEAREKK